MQPAGYRRFRLLPRPSATTLIAAGLIAATLSPLSYSQSPGVDFDRQVHAILADHCLVCHNQEKRSSGLSLGSYQDLLAGGRTGAAVKPGNSAASLLIKRVTGEIAPRMPLGGDPLSEKELAVLRAWIDEGARATPTSAAGKARWEPPLTLSTPIPPEPAWTDWTDPIDRFASVYLSKQGASKPSLASDAEFARRVYLDIWGLLPTPDQTRNFLTSTDPGKRTKLVASLLADPQKYAENWISFWNDLLRNDEGITYYSETATRKTITPWLLQALQTNKRYDVMIRQLLNPIEADDPEGFLIGVNWRGTVSAAQTPAMQASQNAAQIFLGINFKCNSCHDSFINRWKLKDAYALASYFSAEDKLQLYRCDVEQPGQFATAKYMYPEIDRPLPSNSIADRRATIAAIFTDPQNGRVARTLVNRIWARLMGRGIVDNVDDLDGEPWSPELLDWIASDFVKHGSDIKRLIATIASSRTYQLQSVADTPSSSKTYWFRGPELRRLTAEQFADAVASVTGDWHVARPRPRPGPTTVPSAETTTEARTLAVFSGAPVDTEANQIINRPPPTPPARAPNSAPAEKVVVPPVRGGEYAREWRVAANSLTRALGRPIRDQVYSTRENLPTTIQALELVNGETLTHWLTRGAQRMLGELPPEPVSLFSGQVNGPAAPFDVDISKAQKLYLIVEDNLSTAPDKATPIWLDATLVGPNGNTPLSSLRPEDTQGLRDDSLPVIPSGATDPAIDAIRVKFPSVLVYNISGKGFSRLEGAASLENAKLVTGESVAARFFLFDQKPDMDRLAPPSPDTPLPSEPVLRTVPETVDRVYWYLLGRKPSAAETQIATAALGDPARPGHPSSSGLADLLWALLMSPEFQLIR